MIGVLAGVGVLIFAYSYYSKKKASALAAQGIDSKDGFAPLEEEDDDDAQL